MRSAVVLLALVALARGLGGQAGTSTEVDVGPFASWARRDFYGASIGVSRRPGGQGRVTLTAAGGVLDGQAGMRLEATAQFLVTPGARRGLSPYGGIGVAYMGARRYPGTGAIVVLCGLEAAEGTRRGWFGEVGLGGGLRVRLGHRWRRFPAW